MINVNSIPNREVTAQIAIIEAYKEGMNFYFLFPLNKLKMAKYLSCHPI